ncbi:MAG TPA: Gfo/Idh/MocA family oxidoreductase, partial [Candidatus Methylacidiphilales bacterium]|nr:Gfo/Idh/MocA family oxidoreductase [Candidatus Methylacidiphilales bacterium]
MSKVRLGLIGAGGISKAHAEGILEHRDKIECVALCDVSEANLDARAQQLGNNPRRFHDWKTMLAEMGGGLDAVDICLPHHLHAPAIFDAAAAGKHVLCEKPMCINLEEADRIVDTVKTAGIIYMSAHNQLFTPALLEMKRMIDAGDLGKVYWIRSQDAFAIPVDAIQGQWRSQAKNQGGGELIDTGYHPTYRLIFLAGSEVAAVRGTMGRFRVHMDGEDTASVQVRFANGIIGEIFTSWAMPKPHGTHDLHVVGEKGEVFGTGSEVFHLPSGAKTPTEKTLPNVHTFAAQIGCFADCILEGKRPPHGPEEGREVLRIILKAAESAAGW